MRGGCLWKHKLILVMMSIIGGEAPACYQAVMDNLIRPWGDGIVYHVEGSVVGGGRVVGSAGWW